MSESDARLHGPAAVLRWLCRRRVWAPAALVDEVQRRTAPAMQLLFLMYGLALPANWMWQLARRPIPHGWELVLAMDLLSAGAALAGFVLIRMGRMRHAVRLFIVTLLGNALVTWHKLGAHALLIDQTALLLLLVVAGLVLGRRALWLTLLGVFGVFAAGMHTDYHGTHDPRWVTNAMRNGPSLLLAYLIITFILDRTTGALRSSLARERRQREALQDEMARREQLQEQLLHAQRLEISGRLASGIAHDFNNVLAVIHGFCEERERDAANGHEREQALVEALDGISLAARRGQHISRSLLRFSRQDLSQREVFCVDEALAQLQPMLRQLLGRHCQLRLGDIHSGAHACMDRNQFDLALLNLAANARDAQRGQGWVEISVHLRNAYVRITVADGGPGMDGLTRQRMFEPFFSTKPPDQGTGLGLAVVHDVIHSSGGHIDVDSAPGHGTRITLALPAVPPHAGRATDA